MPTPYGEKMPRAATIQSASKARLVTNAVVFAAVFADFHQIGLASIQASRNPMLRQQKAKGGEFESEWEPPPLASPKLFMLRSCNQGRAG